MSDPNDNSGGPDPSATTAEATNWFNLYMQLSQDLGAPGFVASHASLMKAMEHVKLPSTFAKLAGAFVNAIAQMAAGALSGIADIKDSSSEGINEITSVTLSELLGVDINLSQNQSSGSGNPTVDAAQTGAAVFQALVGMFGGLQPISPEQGATNAQQFLGFGTNFAVITAFLGILGGLVPWFHLDELKGIGEEVRSSLGLGRLTHTAVTPLVRNMISQPLDLWLKSQLRPDRLAEAQLVRALRAGLMEQGDVEQQLAEKGYTDDAISFLLTDLSVKLGMSDLILLLNNGDITEQDVINNLTLTGMPEDQAQLQLKAAQLGPARTQQMALLSELETAYVGGFVTQEQYNSILANLSLGDLEEQNFRAKVGFKQEVPRKVVSFAEVKTAIVENIVDFSYLDTWFASEGYDQQSQMIMTYQVLEAIKNAENKVLFAKYKAQVLTKAGKPVPPWITAAEQPI